MTITPPDIAICTILGFFTFNGFRHGFIEEMARLISLVCGFIFASKFHNLLIPYLHPYINEENVLVTVAYLGVFVISEIVITPSPSSISQGSSEGPIGICHLRPPGSIHRHDPSSIFSQPHGGHSSQSSDRL